MCKRQSRALNSRRWWRRSNKQQSTEYVYSITNYKNDSSASARNNKATFDLLSQLLTLAKNEKTATRFAGVWGWHQIMLSQVQHLVLHSDAAEVNLLWQGKYESSS